LLHCGGFAANSTRWLVSALNHATRSAERNISRLRWGLKSASVPHSQNFWAHKTLLQWARLAQVPTGTAASPEPNAMSV